MKLHSETRLGINFVTALDGALVQVNETQHPAPLIVMAQRLINTWQPASFDVLAAEHFIALAELGVEIVLLGTGSTQPLSILQLVLVDSGRFEAGAVAGILIMVLTIGSAWL